MFQTTFLGHQSWLFSTSQARILVDPILHDVFGQISTPRMKTFPPKKIIFEKFPSIHAVIYTHEHEDHFNIPSIQEFNRQIPIYLPTRSSSAAADILREMGFQVLRYHPGDTIKVKDFLVTTFSAENVSLNMSDEWDTTPFFVTNLERDGNFFSAVDVEMTPKIWARLESLTNNLGVYSNTCNISNKAYQKSWSHHPSIATLLHHLASYSKAHPTVNQPTLTPQLIWVNGTGWSFTGDLDWLNQNAFLDTDKIFRAIGEVIGQDKIDIPVPGKSVLMSKGKISKVESESPYISVLPKTEWPSRSYLGDVQRLDTYEPACGKYELSQEERTELENKLTELAQYLYGSLLFKSLYSLSSEDCNGKEAKYVLTLLSNKDRDVISYEYDPSSCQFSSIDIVDPMKQYLAGAECWATDLLSVLSCKMTSTNLLSGRMRLWNLIPTIAKLSIELPIFLFSTPLRKPKEFLNLYRSLYQREKERKPRIRFAQ